MSAPDISRQIACLSEVTENIVETYDSVKDLRGLPEAFQEVNKRLPLVEQTLRDTKSPSKKLKSANDVKALETVLYSCEEKAGKLLQIVAKVGKKSENQYDSSVYRKIAIKQGKHRVETLMDGILEDLGVLVAHNVFPAEIQKQVEPLAKAREELAKVSPSLGDSDLTEQSGAANQYGDNNRQYNLFSEGTQKVADGHYFEAKGDQNFGIIPAKESAAMKVA